MKQTILVTGGTGFIGSHTTVELQQAGYNVVIVDDLSNSKIEVLDGIEKITGIRPAFEQVDLRDKAATEAVFKKYPAIEVLSTLLPARLWARACRSLCSTTATTWFRSSTCLSSCHSIM